MLKKVGILLMVTIVVAGCLKNDPPPNNPCNYDACRVQAPEAEVQAVKHYLDSVGIVAQKHCSGVYYVINNQGTGDSITACDAIVATYSGRLADGTQFDAGQFNQYIPLGNLVRGWTNTIPLINVGGSITLYIPPSLGYGSQPPPGSSIPPNSMLIFDVKVDAIY